MDSIEGAGLGLRQPHLAEILDGRPPVPWFEVLVDNYLGIGGRRADELLEVRGHYPFVFHGVGMNLGSTDPLEDRYLDALLALRDRLQPAWISDHLSWTAVGGSQHHDLLPLPFTEAAIDHVSDRIARVQDRLGERILVENASAYVAFDRADCTEWEFVRAIAERADCHILLDINNVYVNARNFGFDPRVYIEAIPAERVRQLHLAGHDDQETHLVDTHGAPIAAAVWELYRESLPHLGPVPVCIERDQDIPSFDTLLGEALRAEEVLADVTAPLQEAAGSS